MKFILYTWIYTSTSYASLNMLYDDSYFSHEMLKPRKLKKTYQNITEVTIN